jgi:exodeoxyribonuclease VII small subunit
MSKATKSNEAPAASLEAIPFEAAVERLEGVVEAMEAEDLPLESLLAKFEEGVRLAKTCQAKLSEAELKVKQLETNLAGELKIKPASQPEEDEL